MADSEVKPLSALAVGQSGTVYTIDLVGPVRRRLVEMGITPGTLIKMAKRAPLGDPLEVRLRGYELTLRAEDAARIGVIEAKGEAR